MARQVLPIVGYAIGAYFGGPWGAAIGQAIGTVVGNAVDPLIIDGPKIGDVAQQTSSEGVYQPIYFGTTQGAGNIIAQGPNVIRKRRQSQGKGGGPITVTETLYKTFAIRIGVSWTGEQGITGISRIWENGKLVYDTREGSTILPESANFQTKFRLYLGTSDQAPDPALEAIYGVGNTPSYRGRAYIVFPLYDITQWRAIPQYSFEVVTGGGSVPAYDTMMSGTRAGLEDDNGYAAISADPEDWIPVPHSALGFSGIPVFCEDRWVMVTNTQCAWTDDLTGLTGWQAGTVEPGPNTLLGAKYLGNGRILAAGNSGTLMLSIDKGESFRVIDPPNTGANISVIANSLGEAIIGSGSNENHLYTQDYGQSIFTAANPATTYALTSGYYRYDQEGWYVGGGSSILTGPGEITRLASPNAAPIALVTDAPSQVVAMAYRPTLHIDGDLCVALCHEGEIIYTTNDWLTYTISSASLPGSTTARPFTFDGQRFIIGYNGDAGEDAVVYTFTDPEILHGPYLNTLQDNFAIETSFMGVVQVSAEPPTLDQVVSTIHTYCGQSASEYDVSLLSDIIVRGLVLAGAYTGKDAINTLQQLWMIDSPEYDKKIHYRKRGANVVETLTFDDLIDEPEDATREQVIEYPKKLHLDYQSPVVDYAPAKATSSRSSIDARVVGEISIQVPVVLTANEAFQRTAVLHKVSWADADGEVVFSVPDQYLGLVPGDCVSLFLRGNIRRLRIDRVEYYPGRLKLTCRGDRQSAYTSNVEGLTPPPPTPPPPSIVGATMLIVGDWPALRDQDDQTVPVKYFAMGGTNEAWHGALGEQSLDGGTSYSEILEVYSGAVMGTLQEGISDASPYFADHTNTVVVQLDLDDFEIDSLTESQFLSENGGFALVKPDNTFELMQYRDAVDMGDGLYELSYLQRGRLNSETHAFEEGDRFVLLSTVAVVPASTAQIGMDVYHRATSFGQTTEDGTVVNDVYEGNSQREWPVAHVLLERSGDTISGSIVPRHRFGTEINPIRSINWTHYEITFQDSIDQFETVVQTADTFSYDASAMTFPVTVTVYQVNRITGAGPGKSEVIE